MGTVDKVVSVLTVLKNVTVITSMPFVTVVKNRDTSASDDRSDCSYGWGQ